jgi:hypothetical protein
MRIRCAQPIRMVCDGPCTAPHAHFDEQVTLEAQTKRETDAAAAAALQSIQKLASELADKTEQLEAQTLRGQALGAELDRTSHALRAKEAELSSAQAELQVNGRREHAK